MTDPDCPIVDFHDDRIDMAHWFPKLRDIDVPTPESQPLPLDRSGDGPPEWDTDLAVEIVENLGGDAFVRSGYKSSQMALSEGSHIYEATPDEVDSTLTELLSQHVMMRMPIGESLWLRELLDVNWCSYSRDPLVPEVRVFIRDGDVVCHHPRLEGFDHAPGGDEKRETAESFIEQGWDEEVEECAQRVADEFDGWWSVDFVLTTDGSGWYCTDMALDGVYDGEKRGQEGWQNLSEHAEGCPHNLQEQYND